MKNFLLVLLTLITFCHVPDAVAEMTLAVIAPKAGVHRRAGEELFEGARIAIEEINNNGGINGERLDLLTIDDRCDDRLALSTAEMLTLLKSKKIGLVIGPYCSNRFDEIASIYEKAKIFQIVPTTEAYQSGDIDKKGQIVLLGTKTQMSKDFFKFYNNNFAGLNVGFVYDGKSDSAYAEVAQSLHDEFRRYGKAGLLKIYTLKTEKNNNRSHLINKLDKENIHIVFTLGTKKEVAPFIRELKKHNKDLIIFTSKKMISKKTLAKLDDRTDGLYVISLPGLKDSLMFTENLVNLRLLGIEPKGLETYSYVSVKLWKDLAEQVKSFDYNKMTKAANSDTLKEEWGEFLMHSGSLGSIKYIIETYKDGTFKQIY